MFVVVGSCLTGGFSVPLTNPVSLGYSCTPHLDTKSDTDRSVYPLER